MSEQFWIMVVQAIIIIVPLLLQGWAASKKTDKVIANTDSVIVKSDEISAKADVIHTQTNDQLDKLTKRLAAADKTIADLQVLVLKVAEMAGIKDIAEEAIGGKRPK